MDRAETKNKGRKANHKLKKNKRLKSMNVKNKDKLIDIKVKYNESG